MGYEIPQPLKYEEKIMFGLTFKQILVIGIFGLISAFVFFKTNLVWDYKIAIVTVLTLLAVGFAFLGLGGLLMSIFGFAKQKKKLGFVDEQISNLLPIKTIEGNAIHLENGNMRAVISVKPINFNLMGKPEQNAIVSAYKEFLNSLDFPVQISIRTVNLSLDSYLAKVREDVFTGNNRKLIGEYESFEKYIKNYVTENRVKNKLFYIILPYNPTHENNPVKDFFINIQNIFRQPNKKKKTTYQLALENAYHELNVRSTLCMEKLQRCGLFTQRLTNNELASLLASFFEGFVEYDEDYLSRVTFLSNFINSENQEQDQNLEYFGSDGL